MIRTPKRSKADETMQMASEIPISMSHAMTFSDVLIPNVPECIPFEENLLTHYNVSNPDAASRLVDLMRSIYAHSHPLIREALANMTFSMYNKINQFNSMEKQIASLLEENQELKDSQKLSQESEQEHERNKTFVIPALEVSNFLMVYWIHTDYLDFP